MIKLRKRLTDKEAEFLGLEPKENEPQRNTARYYLTVDEWKRIRDFRNENTLAITGTSTLEDSEGNIKLKWVKRNQDKEEILKALKSVVNALKDDIEPTQPISKPKTQNNKNICNQYTLTDYHLGMMSWADETGDDWDLKIAEEVLIKFFKTAIEQSPNAETAIFAQIGDFLHWDGLDAVTPANKHILDADTRFTKLVRVAIRVIRSIIEMLLKKYKKVTVIMAEGNHDPASSVWLREMLSSFYSNEPRLFIDTNPDPYYCVTFGKCCLFYHHGHKRGIKNIEPVFVGKYKKEFGNSKYVYGHIGHLHHLKEETNLMTIEQHRTLAAKDAYASRGGYLSGRDAKVITYHKKYGEVGRNIINIDMLR